MDINYTQLEAALQESFRCYLAFLSHTRKHQQLRLPRRGKGVETTSDVSAEEFLREKAVAAEICLRYAEKIARRVKRWASDPDEEITGITETMEYPSLNLETFLPDSDICPFVDPFTGQWISPRTPHTAESSRSKRREASVRKDENAYSSMKDIVLQENPISSIEHNSSIKAVHAAPVPSADATAISKSNTVSSISSTDSGDTQFTPLTTTSSVKSSNESSKEETSAAEESSDEESTDEDDFENMSVTSEQANTFYKLSQREIDDEAYARLICSEEQETASKLDNALSQARKLASEWEQEQKKRLRDQEAYAKKIEKREKEEAARTARDRDIAKRAEEQIQWELDAIARETEAMRAEERKRREIEEERKERLEREKKRAAEVAEQKRVAEEARKKREKQLKRKREKQRREAEEKKQALARQTECISCLEMGDKNNMAILQCKHAYCGECISRAFKSSLKSRSQFKCCRIPVPIATTTTHITPPLSKSTIRAYTLMELELTTKNPKYCSSKSCHRFIPPAHVKAQVATCPKCNVRTCAACGKKEHSGVCREDQAGKAVKVLARKKGWKACPGCSQFVDKTEGCLHMTCRCKAEWCYSCLREWSVCNSTCERD